MRTSLAAVLCVVGGLCLSPGCSSEHDPEDMADVLDFSVPADAQALADLAKLPCEADPATATCLVGAGHTTIQSAIDDAACTRVCVPSGTYSERLLVRRAVEVIGYGAGSSIIDGSAAGRVIDVATAEAVVFRGLTVRNGNGDEGAGIRSTAILSLDAVTVSGNAATLRGAGIFQRGGSLTLAQNSVVQDNVLTVQRTGTESPFVSYGGAGLYATQTMVLVDESAISKNACSLTWTNNDANVSGGGVLVENASLVLTHSTISENTVAGKSPTLNSYVQG